MSEEIDLQKQTICNECIYYTLVEGSRECLHPNEFGVDSSNVIFCNSFQPAQQI
ncbi:MAG: hypothetical protein QNJ47_23165 [Nostocaceae cyanobacterium]|nr:hypothetical protein [Nostocaceae cyanobacterium]